MATHYKASVILRLISGILLLIAIGSHPYSYYILLRWIVCGTSLFSGWVFSEIKQHNWAWAFFIIGILFNPIIPVYLDKTSWVLIDLISAALLFYSLKFIKEA
ncbi:MAG: hypothetical protein LC122_07350 [Chitinophagales bacterium]|nr:hypothetical protein [Chitinophagales bacterium]